VSAPIDQVLERMRWMERSGVWPRGLRYLWTDAFGVVLLVSLSRAAGDDGYLDRAEWLVDEVERVLGRDRGLRIGEEADRYGQYFHYLAMWIFALHVLGRERRGYAERALAVAREIHPSFVVPGVGVHWKMLEDLSGPEPGFGFGAIDPFHGYVVYRLVGAAVLSREIAEMEELLRRSYPRLHVTQDLGLGMILWLSHFFPDETWARLLRQRALATLSRMWIDPPGYFCREPDSRDVKFAFTNYGVAIGLQAVGAHLDRVRRLNEFFWTYRSGDGYDANAITHVMACSARLPGVLLAHGGEPGGPAAGR
jgi:hypothetical protein